MTELDLIATDPAAMVQVATNGACVNAYMLIAGTAQVGDAIACDAGCGDTHVVRDVIPISIARVVEIPTPTLEGRGLELVREARAWVSDCVWREDPDAIESLSEQRSSPACSANTSAAWSSWPATSTSPSNPAGTVHARAITSAPARAGHVAPPGTRKSPAQRLFPVDRNRQQR